MTVNELDSTVTSYLFDAKIGTLEPRQILSCLPATYTGDSRGAEIEVDKRGRFVYASNRGFDSIAVFAIDAASGLLRLIEIVSTNGKTPRYFALSPSGRALFALNEDSDSIVVMDVDATTGRLRPTDAEYRCGSPVCMVFSPPN